MDNISDEAVRRLLNTTTAWKDDVFGTGAGWYASGDSTDCPPMVFDSSGDAIVSQMPDGKPYFEPEVASFIGAVSPEIVASLCRELLELRASVRTQG